MELFLGQVGVLLRWHLFLKVPGVDRLVTPVISSVHGGWCKSWEDEFCMQYGSKEASAIVPYPLLFHHKENETEQQRKSSLCGCFCFLCMCACMPEETKVFEQGYNVQYMLTRGSTLPLSSLQLTLRCAILWCRDVQFVLLSVALFGFPVDPGGDMACLCLFRPRAKWSHMDAFFLECPWRGGSGAGQGPEETLGALPTEVQ